MDSGKRPVAFVVGAGEGTGAAIARRFAKDGYVACVSRRAENADKLQKLVDSIRSAGDRAESYPLDSTKADEVAAAVDKIEREVGPIEVVVFNVGVFLKCSLFDTSAETFQQNWQTNCYGAFVVAKECATRMKERGHGTIIFSGVPAGVKAFSEMSAYCATRYGVHGMAAAMAKELAPIGIHVCYAILGGFIDTADVQRQMPEYHASLKAKNAMLLPEKIAENYLMLHRQTKDTWTFELELKPAAADY